ncbi:MAG: type III-A CRISPR-associated protein Csm2 [Candidatus Bilamarchaeaceae archaeon]
MNNINIKQSMKREENIEVDLWSIANENNPAIFIDKVKKLTEREDLYISSRQLRKIYDEFTSINTEELDESKIKIHMAKMIMEINYASNRKAIKEKIKNMIEKLFREILNSPTIENYQKALMLITALIAFKKGE